MNHSRKIICLGITCLFFFATGVVRAEQNQDKILILEYSGIVRNPNGKNVSARSFKKHIELLKKNGYQTIRLQDLFDFYYQNKPLPNKSVLITFDGSRYDSYRYADKLLKDAQYNAVMFLLPDKITSGDHFFICWHDVKNMLKSKRWEFGLTSDAGYKQITVDAQQKKGPYLFSRQWFDKEKRYESDKEVTDRIRKEYVDPKVKVSKKIKDLNLYAVSIPYGNYFFWSRAAGDDLCFSSNKRFAEENFKLVFLQGTDGFVTKKNNPLSLGRLIVSGDWSELDFAYHLGLQIPRLVRFFDDFKNNRLKHEWMISSGRAYAKDNKLYMYPIKYRNDVFLYLLGSEGIDNCIIETQAQAEAGCQFWLYAKYLDRNNYVRFGFADGRFYLQRLVNGNMQEQAKGKDAYIKEEPHNYKLILKKNSTLAILDGSRFAKISGIDRDSKGVIAVEAWGKSTDFIGAQLSYFRIQSFREQWACFTPKNADEVNSYKDTLMLSSVFSPLCFERKGTEIALVSDINLMRMISGHYSLYFVPRLYLSDFDEKDLDGLKSWAQSLENNYSAKGLNIELSDRLCKDTKFVNSLTARLSNLFGKDMIGLVLTVNIPSELEDYYTKDVIAKCGYLIVKNSKLSQRLSNTIGANARLIKSLGFKEDILETNGGSGSEILALW